MGNILGNREWTQHENEDDHEASKPTREQDENVNPSTPIVESASKMIRRKISAVVNNGAEYTRVASTDSTPISNKVILGSNFDPRSPTSGIVRTPIIIANAGNEVKKGPSGFSKRFEN